MQLGLVWTSVGVGKGPHKWDSFYLNSRTWQTPIYYSSWPGRKWGIKKKDQFG